MEFVLGNFLCCVEREKCYFKPPLALHRQQPENDKQNVDVAPLGKNFPDVHDGKHWK